MRRPEEVMVAILLASALASGFAGCSKTLVFGTATKFGLDISQRPDQMIEVTMGYDRYEITSIPAQEKDAKREEDTYSVLGIFSVSYGNHWSEPLVLRQFFATGWAARDAAGNPGFQKFFGNKTGEIILQGEREIEQQRAKKRAQ